MIRQGLSQDCHTLTDMNLHKQIIFSALLTVCESVYLFVEYEKRSQKELLSLRMTVHLMKFNDSRGTPHFAEESGSLNFTSGLAAAPLTAVTEGL